jgi:hypothetical protein
MGQDLLPFRKHRDRGRVGGQRFLAVTVFDASRARTQANAGAFFELSWHWLAELRADKHYERDRDHIPF